MNTHKGYFKIITLIGLTLMLALSAATIHASSSQQTETDFNAIDAYIEEQMERLGIPGLALGIVQDGQVALLQGFGSADSSGRPVTPQTPFYIASLTKSFTALAVMQLVEEGKINLDSPVQSYLSGFELADKQASAKITVRNLLNQTSGISREVGDLDWNEAQGSKEISRSLMSVELITPPGASFEYSNLNYIIAGWIVEQVSGQSFSEYITEHIFKPLDMRHSYTSRFPALEDGLAEGYTYMFSHAFVAKEEGSFGLASGGLIASVEDMAQYAIAHLNNGSYGGISIISPQGMDELHTPAIPAGTDSHYAMGWVVGTHDGRYFIEHSGALYNFRTNILLLPETGEAVILLANANGFEQLLQTDDLSKQIEGMLHGKSPMSVSWPFHFRFLYWTLLLTPFIQIIGVVYSWQNRQKNGISRIIFTVVFSSGIALLFLFGVPQLTGFPIWPDMHRAYPEMFYGLITSTVLGFGWSVVYAIVMFRMRDPKRDPNKMGISF